MIIAAVVPAYKVRGQILQVIEAFGPEVDLIFVVDDSCPENSGELVKKNVKDHRVRVITHPENRGVGGAVITGYSAALEAGADIVVKVDGDGQMDPTRVLELTQPISSGKADYVKANRFNSLEDLIEMPRVRIFGNGVLSLFSKFSSGYWSINDPTNGFTAIRSSVLRQVAMRKLRQGYFFESDLLFRLSLVNAVVKDVPMKAHYGEEVSNLRIRRVLFEFPYRHAVNMLKRVLYKYFLREWSIATFELPLSLLFTSFGVWFGIRSAIAANSIGEAATAGQVMISSLGIILGVQFALSFLAYDIQSEPNQPVQER